MTRHELSLAVAYWLDRGFTMPADACLWLNCNKASLTVADWLHSGFMVDF